MSEDAESEESTAWKAVGRPSESLFLDSCSFPEDDWPCAAIRSFPVRIPVLGNVICI